MRERPVAAPNEVRSLGGRLKLAREVMGMSREQARKQMHIARATLEEIEAGKREVGRTRLNRFSELYRRPLEFFTGEPDERMPKDETLRFIVLAAAQLEDKDRDEVLKFALFLHARNRIGNNVV